MKKIKDECYLILSLIEKSNLKETDYYSIVCIKRALTKLLDEINSNDIEKMNINFLSLARNFVDDTGDYSNDILKELENLSKDVEKLKLTRR
ncbi:TPA: hemagglutinin [Listeria monocytogenes]|nr:hemagglutinin [Listeria monocytogenes]